MNNIAIRVESLSKRYKIGTAKKHHDTLRDHIADVFSNLILRNRASSKAKDGDTIWALKDISLEINKGEVLGIIGPNGAGKSTLLKILSRITVPTTGHVEVFGRVGSLLEVGTGFHKELTGRENIYLNGAILGMGKSEIDQKFDEIVEFSGVQEFLDTPIKRYSSGMHLRLAFSVAAHLEPEILMIDEVLAVGDLAFQRKCLDKMKEVTQQGRTIVFVSHFMPAIEKLCKRVIWLEKAEIIQDGETKKVVASYIDSANKNMEARRAGVYQNLGHRRGTGEVQFTGVRLINGAGNETREFEMGEILKIEADFEVYKAVEQVVFSFWLVDASSQTYLTRWISGNEPLQLTVDQKGRFSIHLSTALLRTRNYYVKLIINDGLSTNAFDIWDGVGTEFFVKSFSEGDNVDPLISEDITLATLPVEATIQKF